MGMIFLYIHIPHILHILSTQSYPPVSLLHTNSYIPCHLIYSLPFFSRRLIPSFSFPFSSNPLSVVSFAVVPPCVGSLFVLIAYRLFVSSGRCGWAFRSVPSLALFSCRPVPRLVRVGSWGGAPFFSARFLVSSYHERAFPGAVLSSVSVCRLVGGASRPSVRPSFRPSARCAF